MWVNLCVKLKGRKYLAPWTVFVRRIRMRGLVHIPGESMKVIVGWGWEGNEFVVHVEPLRWPQAVA